MTYKQKTLFLTTLAMITLTSIAMDPKGHGKAPAIEVTCSLCSEVDARPIRQLSCKHIFHKACVDHWLATADSNNVRCPLCRAEVTDADVSQLRKVYRENNQAAYEKFLKLGNLAGALRIEMSDFETPALLNASNQELEPVCKHWAEALKAARVDSLKVPAASMPLPSLQNNATYMALHKRLLSIAKEMNELPAINADLIEHTRTLLPHLWLYEMQLIAARRHASQPEYQALSERINQIMKRLLQQ
jgi:hypothetical protein